jgi:hypothetical protein
MTYAGFAEKIRVRLRLMHSMQWGFYIFNF